MIPSKSGRLWHELSTRNLFWIRQPEKSLVNDEKIEIITQPVIDLWQRACYGFRNDNAPVLQMETDSSFTHMDITACKWLPHVPNI